MLIFPGYSFMLNVIWEEFYSAIYKGGQSSSNLSVEHFDSYFLFFHKALCRWRLLIFVHFIGRSICLWCVSITPVYTANHRKIIALKWRCQWLMCVGCGGTSVAWPEPMGWLRLCSAAMDSWPLCPRDLSCCRQCPKAVSRGDWEDS